MRIKNNIMVVLLLLLLPIVSYANHLDSCKELNNDYMSRTRGGADPTIDPNSQHACEERKQREYEIRKGSGIVAGVDYGITGTNDLVGQFQKVAKQWIKPLLKIALNLFFTLFIFELIITFGMMAIRGDLTLGAITVEFTKRVLIAGVGLFLISNPFFLFTILDGFRDVASVVGTSTAGSDWKHDSFSLETNLLILPSQVVGALLDSISDLSWGEAFTHSLPIILCAFFILWGLSTVAIQLILVLCEMYITITIGMFSLAFYSLQFTRGLTMNFFNSVLGLGFKLLTLELLIFLIYQISSEWRNSDLSGHGIQPYLLMATMAMVFKELAVKLPDAMQALFGSGLSSNLNASGAAAAATAPVIAAVAGTARAGAAGGSAVAAAVRTVGAPPGGGVQGLGKTADMNEQVKNWMNNKVSGSGSAGTAKQPPQQPKK